jgi:hypothetical protein
MEKTDDKKDFKRGVFWIVDGELLAIPYDEDAAEGLSKNRANYNHRLLWPEVRPEKCSRSYDYYPRGRVEYTPYGKPVIYMGMTVPYKFVYEIIEFFDISEEPYVKRDGSEHYMTEDERAEERRKRRRRKRRSFDLSER